VGTGDPPLPVTKVIILLDRERPKVKPEQVRQVVSEAGFRVTSRSPDIGVVVGGDGVFSYYGRSEQVPLLFVGVRSSRATGSKAYLAEAYFDGLSEALSRIKRGEFGVIEHRRLEVSLNGKRLGAVFTDVYLQRGAESNSLRYKLEIENMGTLTAESAIGDGVVICTSTGSTGYFSYPDKISLGEWLEPDRFATIMENEIGVCHILPTYTSREGKKEHPLRYTLPWGSKITVKLERPADARLYGVTGDRGGVKIEAKDSIAIGPSQTTTKVIKV
jgi:hypothetical protein